MRRSQGNSEGRHVAAFASRTRGKRLAYYFEALLGQAELQLPHWAEDWGAVADFAALPCLAQLPCDAELPQSPALELLEQFAQSPPLVHWPSVGHVPSAALTQEPFAAFGHGAVAATEAAALGDALRALPA